ncbi:sorting nexin-8a [Callorhinchus milii]|uniref:Sorting nexin 8a n=1 Tax=Callorhinchus milii TaxID=7868 RepID=A0A4W3IA35_CALMI|nr:sorting nexin-8a [Callorhinchus milii]|eukprot:gi/632974939/ref/XP_007903951.1/ PREDICTED: sorting nexin-8 [Callorhinchus milii]
MEPEVNEGSVPPYYREVYEAICCKREDRVQRNVFHTLLNRTELPTAVQNQIAEIIECKEEPISRSVLYKALVLIAFAQQGKQPSAKLLENVTQDFPKPELGAPGELEAVRMQAQANPILVCRSLPELMAIDTVEVELIPEKKGLFLKHVEYEVSSQRFKSSVYRRYNDFVVFHEVLLQRFPYRMVPTLPPKRMLRVDREFIESRRRALKRFANLVARHPFFSEDELLQVFLSFSGSDVQNKIRESFRGVGDEFMTCEIATTAKDLLPPDIQAQFGASRELIRNIYNSFHKLRDRAERMASRSADNATDLLLFGKELSTLGSDTTPVPSWASVTSNTWGLLRQALRGLSVEFALLADKSAQQGKREEEEVVEKLSIFLDLLQSYKDLCERHEKGVLHEHQRALQKYTSMKRQMMSVTVQSKEPLSVEQLESRIVQQENAILNMELRNYFSMYCLHQETQLIHIYLHITSHVLTAFIDSQIQGHREMCEVWNDLKPKLGCLLPNGTPSPPVSPRPGAWHNPSTFFPQ